ncbi:MAG: hypothetical protein ACLTDV_13380 [Eubacterium sp.]
MTDPAKTWKRLTFIRTKAGNPLLQTENGKAISVWVPDDLLW